MCRHAARTWDGNDSAAVITGGSALGAGWLVKVRVRADPVDRETGESWRWGSRSRIELDYGVVQVRRRRHGTYEVAATLCHNLRTGTAAMGAMKPTNSPLWSCPMVARVQ